MDVIASNVKYFRKDNNMTQQEFANLFDLSRGNVASYELGTSPPIPVLVKICDYFKVSISDMVSIDLKDSDVQTALKEELGDVILPEPNIIWTNIGVKAGQLTGGSQEYQEIQTATYMPGLSDQMHYRFEVVGDSMSPTLHQQDSVFALPATKEFIRWGEIYNIFTKYDDNYVTKRIDKHSTDPSKVLLSPDNPAYGNIESELDDIIAIYHVEAFRSRHMTRPTIRKVIDNMKIDSSEDYDVLIEAIADKVNDLNQKKG